MRLSDRVRSISRLALSAWHRRVEPGAEDGAPRHYATAPEDRISFGRKLLYGAGAFVNNLLAAAIGGMVIILNLGLGMNPALVGLVSALPRVTDAITDPVMGYLSDNTRSRWGRRRPYIFVGALAAGLHLRPARGSCPAARARRSTSGSSSSGRSSSTWRTPSSPRPGWRWATSSRRTTTSAPG